MKHKFLFFLLVLVAFASCVPHKKIVYMQGESLSTSGVQEIYNLDYRLQVDDIIKVDIKATNQELVQLFQSNQSTNVQQTTGGGLYFSGYSVDKQGFIELPFLGKINVLGYTTEEVSHKVKSLLSRYFKDVSEMFVSTKLAGIRYTTIGEIGSTGTKVLFQNSVNIIEAVANAGDITPFGDKTNVEIIRKSGDGIQKFRVDLTQMDLFNSEVFYLQPNDIINVPALPQKALGSGVTGTQTLSAILSVMSFISTTYLLINLLK